MKTISITLFTILFTAFCIARLTSNHDSGDKILADVGSEIEVVVCSATSARTSTLRNSELVSNIVNGLPDDVQVLLLVNDLKSFETKSSNNRVKFIELPEETGISIWPQDPFVVVNFQNHTRLVTPCVFDREDDHIMPLHLAEKLNLEVVSSDLHFEGGNIVCGEEAVFIGFNTIAVNSDLFNETSAVIKARFEKLFGRPVVVIGESMQEISHIDLIITPLPGNHIAIADSRLGAGIMQQALLNQPAAIRSFEQECENQFFGRADITTISDLSGESMHRPTVVHQTQPTIEASIAAADQLDVIADQMTQAGYKVVRIPALVPDLTPKFSESGKEKPNYPFITYNNVLLENQNGTPVVYLPQYGCKTLDNAGASRWAELGFRVKTIPGFTTSAMYGGSLRCCTKVLSRKQSL
jgi:hypothetical protein